MLRSIFPLYFLIMNTKTQSALPFDADNIESAKRDGKHPSRRINVNIHPNTEKKKLKVKMIFIYLFIYFNLQNIVIDK